MITLEKLYDDDTGINKNKCHNSLTRMQLYVCICVTAGAHTNTCICVFFHTIKLKVYYILYTSPEKMFPDTKGERTFNKRTAC